MDRTTGPVPAVSSPSPVTENLPAPFDRITVLPGAFSALDRFLACNLAFGPPSKGLTDPVSTITTGLSPTPGHQLPGPERSRPAAPSRAQQCLRDRISAPPISCHLPPERQGLANSGER